MVQTGIPSPKPGYPEETLTNLGIVSRSVCQIGSFTNSNAIRWLSIFINVLIASCRVAVRALGRQCMTSIVSGRESIFVKAGGSCEWASPWTTSRLATNPGRGSGDISRAPDISHQYESSAHRTRSQGRQHHWNIFTMFTLLKFDSEIWVHHSESTIARATIINK
jgi:hypothetical protein